jgi:Kef-type K+ transport system membrane component KefB/Trk K+ transport system NAD-binding subunit
MDSVFAGLSLILVLATAIAFLMRLIGQPLIIGHIITGILVGPAAFNLITDPETFKSFSEIGVALLLFIIGLGLNPKVVKEVGKVVGLAGATEIVATAVLGWAGGRALGLGGGEAFIFGLALSFSSTIVVLKLLGDKREQFRLYGKIAIGMTLIEDIAATVALLFITSKDAGESFSVVSLFFLAMKGLVAGYLMYQISSKLLSTPRMQKLVANSQEFLFLSAISWGFGSAALFEWIGFSQEVGALFAGICLSTLPFAGEVSLRLRPLRDFFIVLFFITLGSQLHLDAIGSMIPVILIGIFIVVVLKPFAALLTVSALGYTKQTSFKAAAMLGQAGEFSIIFLALAISRGLADEKLLSAITVIALVSIATSTYIITYLGKIYTSLEGYLQTFERDKPRPEHEHRQRYDLVLFGYQKGGHEFLRVFQQLKKSYVVVDYDPEMIEAMEHKKINCMYGDAADPEFLEEVGLEHAKLVVSVVSDKAATEYILDYINRKSPSTAVICMGDTPKHAALLYEKGASYVMLPHYIGSEKISSFVRRSGLSKTEFDKYRDKHLEHLKRRNELDEDDEVEHDNKKLGASILHNVANLAKVKPTKP